MRMLYTIGIYLYGLGIRIAGWLNPKAKKWIAGRKGLFRKLEQSLHSPGDDLKETVWFHCASLGEFEQGRPVIERFRELYPGYRIVLSFFSPSGYEVRKTYSGADVIFYLPLDTPANAGKLIGLLNPRLVFFVKYEYWFNMLVALRKRNIPVFIISAVFHTQQPFFKWYGKWFRKQLKNVSWFFVQNESSGTFIETLGIRNYTIAGDTRFDRVAMIREQKKPFPAVEKFAENAQIFLGGSTWEPDEELILSLIRKNPPGLKYIVAPHEVHESRIQELEGKLLALGSGHKVQDSEPLLHHLTKSPPSPPSPVPGNRQPVTSNQSPVLRYSRLTPENAASAAILIIDSIGILAHLYQYASFSMIGGGFGVGIHNILEAAAFGNPVMFGPNYRKFTEAKELIDAGGAFCVKTPADVQQVLMMLLSSSDEYSRISAIGKNYVETGRGATQRILNGIQNLGFIEPALVRT